MTQMEITGTLLSGLLTLIFIGYLILAEYQIKQGRRKFSGPQRFAGGFTMMIGCVMLGSWIYFFIQGRTPLPGPSPLLSAQVMLELISSLSLIIGGASMLQGFRRAPGLLMVAYGILIFTQLMSLVTSGSTGQSLVVNGAVLILPIVLIYFVGLVYAWEHFVLQLDEPPNRPTQEKSPQPN